MVCSQGALGSSGAHPERRRELGHSDRPVVVPPAVIARDRLEAVLAALVARALESAEDWARDVHVIERDDAHAEQWYHHQAPEILPVYPACETLVGERRRERERFGIIKIGLRLRPGERRVQHLIDGDDEGERHSVEEELEVVGLVDQKNRADDTQVEQQEYSNHEDT